jgi:hypothetical protein
MVSVPVRRQQVMDATRRGVSQRRACTLMRVAHSALGDRSRLAAKDAPVLARLAALSGQYPRYGYRRLRIFLARAGQAMSAGRASAVAACRPAASAPAAAQARGERPASGRGTERRQPGLGDRRRVRRLRRWPPAQVPDGGRRVHQGEAGDRGRWPDPPGPRRRGARAAGQPARRAGPAALRQRPGVRRARC